MALATGEQLSGGKVVDADQRQVVAVEGPGGGALPVSGTFTAAASTANALAANAGTVTGGASAALVPSNAGRNGLQVAVDTAATATAYFLLGAGTASATNFHFALSAGGSWDGQISQVLWRGAVQVFSSGTPKIGVAEV